MQLPLKLKGFNLFIEGMNLYGQVVDITRPKVNFKKEDYRAGGMLGEVDIVQGLEKLELEITAGGYVLEMIREMGGNINGKNFRYQGALQQEDSDDYIELEGIGRGRILEMDGGTDKQGDTHEAKFKVSLTYWKESVDGKEVTEIDMLENICRIGGKDQTAGMRKALGM